MIWVAVGCVAAALLLGAAVLTPEIIAFGQYLAACALTVSDLKLDVAKLAGLLGVQALVLPKLPF